MKSETAVRVFGFVANMHELMAASDLVVGKAGGLTLAESFCMGLPIVMVSPVPGQEERNARIVSAAGAGVTTRAPGETIAAARAILGDGARLRAMKDAARRFGRPGAAEAIADMAAS
jgi:processive 1,2-diacylglycerol beta-glucosyltransferase